MIENENRHLETITAITAVGNAGRGGSEGISLVGTALMRERILV
jgi:hypothetical protein